MRAHTRYAISLALKYCQHGLPLALLIAEVKAGILHALTKPDLKRGHFLTYVAYWIRLYILNYVIHSLEFTKLNSETSNSARCFKLRRERVRIANLLGADADNVQYVADRTHPPTAHELLTLENENVPQSAL